MINGTHVPILMQQRRMTYPRPVTTVKQIEITSRCNLACIYCPHPKMQRPKVDMSEETFAATLDLVRHYCEAGTQGELSITGIGEALLHPSFPEWLARAREVIGPSRPLTFSTNGLLLDEARHQARQSAGLRIPSPSGGRR
jgi:MoaA/NifB/PqqE/SkfB family radical SAM enzyme